MTGVSDFELCASDLIFQKGHANREIITLLLDNNADIEAGKSAWDALSCRTRAGFRKQRQKVFARANLRKPIYSGEVAAERLEAGGVRLKGTRCLNSSCLPRFQLATGR